MANQPVKFRKGVSTSLPKTPTNETIGAFLLETDTGNLYVDESSTSRVQIKDSTKADKKHTHTIEDLPFTLKNNTTAGNLNWKDKTTDSTLIPTTNTIAYWNGAFSDSGLSNIEYVKVGPLGTAATLSKSSVINNVSIKDNTLTFNKANNTDTTTVTLPMLKGATTSDDGSLGFVPAPTKSDVNKFLKGDGTWTAIAIPTIPTSLKNPNAITIKLNGGNIEDTNLFTYDGSAVKSIDITPSLISAATSTHAHGNITNDGKVGTVANKVLTTSTGGTIIASDEGTAFNKNFETSTSNIKANGTVSVGTAKTVARADHVHPTDTTRAKAEDLTKHTSDTTVHITDAERTTWNAKQNKLTADTDYITPTTATNTYLNKSPNGTNNLIGTDNKINSVYLPTTNIPTTLPNPQTLTIQVNSETVEGTSLFAYDGSEAESINIKSGKYVTVTPEGDGNITIEGNYKLATSEELGLVRLSNTLGNSEDTAVTQHLVSSKVDELDTKIEALTTKIDGYTQSSDISDYVRCADKVIETGYVDNTYTQVIDNNKISFNQGDTTIASIHDNKIESENVIVHNSINIGDEDSGIFEILVDSTNGLIIR